MPTTLALLVEPVSSESPCGADLEYTQLLASFDAMRIFGNATPLSPEIDWPGIRQQAKGLELDGRGDLYSLGIVFYEILTGAVPFKADSTLSVALKQVGEPLPTLPPEYAAYQEFLAPAPAPPIKEAGASGAER